MDRDKLATFLMNELFAKEGHDSALFVLCANAVDGLLSLLAPELEKARKGLIAVKDLIENSYGVVGLHLNGDHAPWDSLLEGGQFEDWLKDFSEAIKEAT